MDIRKGTERIIVHHADSSNCTLEQIHGWHKDKGWCGIGYHFFIRKNGEIYRGRPEDTVGAHAKDSNFNSIGICFEGAYETEEMPSEQLEAGKQLIKYIEDKYKIEKVQMHKEVNNTSCPGAKFPFEKIVENASQTSGNIQVKKTITKAKSINIVAVKNSKVGTWQKNMNKTYNLKLVVDNCFGNDCKAKANKYCLLKGKIDNMIGWLQKKLNNLGFNSGKVDNNFGPITLNAVLSFQKAKGLKQDGIVGEKTTIQLLK
ncbi:MAG: N-acetylmuramoyl-L-alanine amidase [Clostridia bacterium]|nr:N-acetylmuramoyl-L-alanine amidase [Clostridia bacterium]